MYLQCEVILDAINALFKAFKAVLKIYLILMQKKNTIKSNQIKSNQIKSNQIKSNQIKSNQIKSNQIKSNQIKSTIHEMDLDPNLEYLVIFS